MKDFNSALGEESSSSPDIFNLPPISFHLLQKALLQSSLSQRPPPFCAAILCPQCRSAAFPVLLSPLAMHDPPLSPRNELISSDPPVRHFFCPECQTRILESPLSERTTSGGLKVGEKNSSSSSTSPFSTSSLSSPSAFPTLKSHPLANAILKSKTDVYEGDEHIATFSTGRMYEPVGALPISPIQSFFQHIHSFGILFYHLLEHPNPFPFPLSSLCTIVPCSIRGVTAEFHNQEMSVFAQKNQTMDFLLYAIRLLECGVLVSDARSLPTFSLNPVHPSAPTGSRGKPPPPPPEVISAASAPAYLFPPCHPLNTVLLSAKYCLFRNAVTHFVETGRKKGGGGTEGPEMRALSEGIVRLGEELILKYGIALQNDLEHRMYILNGYVAQCAGAVESWEKAIAHARKAEAVSRILLGDNHFNTKQYGKMVRVYERAKNEKKEKKSGKLQK